MRGWGRRYRPRGQTRSAAGLRRRRRARGPAAAAAARRRCRGTPPRELASVREARELTGAHGRTTEDSTATTRPPSCATWEGARGTPTYSSRVGPQDRVVQGPLPPPSWSDCNMHAGVRAVHVVSTPTVQSEQRTEHLSDRLLQYLCISTVEKFSQAKSFTYVTMMTLNYIHSVSVRGYRGRTHKTYTTMMLTTLHPERSVPISLRTEPQYVRADLGRSRADV